jgi:hypothetical protein
MQVMAVADEIRTRLSQWCSARVPDAERQHRQIAYTIQGDDVTIVERRPPAYPELGPAWSTAPVARLHLEEGGTWTLLRPVDGGEWRRASEGPDPIALLDEIAA